MSASHEDIERRAFQLWQDRGCPVGSPEVEWEQAEGELSASPGPPAKLAAWRAEFVRVRDRPKAPSIIDRR